MPATLSTALKPSIPMVNDMTWKRHHVTWRVLHRMTRRAITIRPSLTVKRLNAAGGTGSGPNSHPGRAVQVDLTL